MHQGWCTTHRCTGSRPGWRAQSTWGCMHAATAAYLRYFFHHPCAAVESNCVPTVCEAQHLEVGSSASSGSELRIFEHATQRLRAPYPPAQWWGCGRHRMCCRGGGQWSPPKCAVGIRGRVFIAVRLPARSACGRTVEARWPTRTFTFVAAKSCAEMSRDGFGN